MSIKDIIERWADESPEMTFVKANGTAYTWRDINRGASVIAGELYALGAGPGSHVALCGANSVNWILAFFAIQKIGAVAVLLNPQLTPEEITALSKQGDITHFCFGKTPVRNRNRFSSLITDPEKSRIRPRI